MKKVFLSVALLLLVVALLASCVYGDSTTTTTSKTTTQTTTTTTTTTTSSDNSDPDPDPDPDPETNPEAYKGLKFTLSEDGESYSVTGIGTYTAKNLIIPDTHNGLPVTEIGYEAFYRCTGITSVTIEGGITSIDYGAFCYIGFRHSLCHGWASGVLAFIIERMLGSALEKENGILFYRFNLEQRVLFQPRVRFLEEKMLSTAGIQLFYQTNSTTLYLRATLSKGSASDRFSFDLFVNGTHIDSLENFSQPVFDEDTGNTSYALGTYEKNFVLGPGTKAVCLYFPWSVATLIEDLSLDDNASLTPMLPEKKLLV